ncbi:MULTISPECIES: hypothetical protein [Cyanophyceae]|uniref:Uncharacterized protein n=1 Tax=Leptolyngbya subtilissima DQ-A4 TaxID=2933933 RepID=A0ABV0JXW9_9CYAN|nr:hypothetical protein [Nodosilinea sp. FACHB-141]MBD2111991.1 hypothetical protein [Nodosilinea sp. FACHB-141]
MSNPSLFDWVSVLGPILFSWPLLITVVLILFYKPLFNLLEQISNQNIQKAKIGPFEIEEAEQPYVESIQLLLTSLVSEDELNHLQQLNSGGESTSYEGTTEFTTELKRLSSLGFINLKVDLDKMPKSGELKQQVELTEKGKQYLTLRDSLLAEQPEHKDQGKKIET